MSSIQRDQFLRQFAGKALELSKVDAETKKALKEAGSDLAKIAKSDLNGDGYIAGTRELRSLYRHFDSFDRNGSSASFTEKTPQGEATPAGKMYNALSLLFAEASDAVLTKSEMTAHDQMGKLMAEGGANSIETKMSGHLDSIEKTGVGLYFGDHSNMNDMSMVERQAWIDDHAIDGTAPPKAEDLTRSSCIAWAMDNVEAAYLKAGKAERWSQIKRAMRKSQMRGTVLAKELQKDGWEAVYWNPDTRKASDGDAEHTYSAAMVRRGRPYYGIKVDHQVLNYRPTAGGPTTKDMKGIECLEKVPFFFGLARGGKHTFVGRAGKVNEFHWSDMPNSTNAIEERSLEEFPWLSGVLMVPPGTWPK